MDCHFKISDAIQVQSRPVICRYAHFCDFVEIHWPNSNPDFYCYIKSTAHLGKSFYLQLDNILQYLIGFYNNYQNEILTSIFCKTHIY